jgi:hypothetical protein
MLPILALLACGDRGTLETRESVDGLVTVPVAEPVLTTMNDTLPEPGPEGVVSVVDRSTPAFPDLATACASLTELMTVGERSLSGALLRRRDDSDRQFADKLAAAAAISGDVIQQSRGLLEVLDTTGELELGVDSALQTIGLAEARTGAVAAAAAAGADLDEIVDVYSQLSAGNGFRFRDFPELEAAVVAEPACAVVADRYDQFGTCVTRHWGYTYCGMGFFLFNPQSTMADGSPYFGFTMLEGSVAMRVSTEWVENYDEPRPDRRIWTTPDEGARIELFTVDVPDNVESLVAQILPGSPSPVSSTLTSSETNESVLAFERTEVGPDGDIRKIMVLDRVGDRAAVALLTATEKWFRTNSAKVLPFLLTLKIVE